MRYRCFELAVAAFCLLVSMGHGSAFAEPVELVNDGQSEFAIFHAPDAPDSVRQGADDLQHYLHKATGAQLPIVEGDEAPGRPVISLGDNAAARSAGIDVHALPTEGYHILTSGGNLHIVGSDTADGELTEEGGTSTGTRNGVFTFLEDYVDVRWLMPGEIGEDVPHHDVLRIESVDRIDAPGFANRRVPYIQRDDERVQDWMARQKLGYSLRLRHGHYWRATVPAELYDEHPDWFPMRNGERVPPVGRYKLETTNPELVRYYADQAIEAFRNSPDRYSYSLSPSDSRGWSESPESLALQEEDPHGNLSVTPMILQFYRQVAERVGEVFPDRIVAGYIYADYVFPPKAGIPELPDNLFLVVAPNMSYGYGLYEDSVRKDWEHIVSEWSGATDQVAYYDLPAWLRQEMGAPNAPGVEIMKTIFPRLKELNYRGVYIYGIEAWGHGALTNYLLAKLSWDPDADVDALMEEFCVRAYGPQAGPIIQGMYASLDERTKRFHRENPDARYSMTPQMLQEIYATPFDELEATYLEAEQAVQSEDDAARLDMLGQCLVLLRWNLEQRGMIEPDSSSPLARTDDEITQMLSDPAQRLAVGAVEAQNADAQGAAPAVKVRHLSEAPANAEPVQPWQLRGSSRLLIYPLGDHEIMVRFKQLSQRGELVRYRVQNALGEQVDAGVAKEEKTIRFAGSERQVYLFDINARSASYQIEVEGAPFAVQSGVDKERRFHLLSKTTPLYFHVPEEADEFAITLSSSSPGETAAVDVVRPDGEAVASLDTSNQGAVRQAIQPGSHAGQFWKIAFKEPRDGLVDDVYIQLSSDLPQWFVVDPQQPLRVEPIE